MPRKPAPKPIGTEAYKLKLFAADQKFIKREAIRRGVSEAALIRTLVALGSATEANNLKASYALNKASREAQQTGMRTVFAEQHRERQQDLQEIVAQAVSQTLAQRPAPGGSTLDEPIYQCLRFSETAARHAQQTARDTYRLRYLMVVLLNMFCLASAKIFSLFEHNTWDNLHLKETRHTAFEKTVAAIQRDLAAEQTRAQAELHSTGNNEEEVWPVLRCAATYAPRPSPATNPPAATP